MPIAPGCRDNLIESIYGGLDDVGWKNFLDQFRAALDFETVVFSIHYPVHPEWSITIRIGGSPRYWHEIDTTWKGQNPWTPNVDMSKVTPGDLRRSQDLCPDEQLESTEMYRALFKPFSLQYGGGMVLACSADQIAVISTLRSKEKGPMTEAEFELWHSLGPHLVRATAMHQRLVNLAAERDLLISHFNDAGVGLVLVKQDGHVLLANLRAEEVLEKSDRLNIVDGVLRARVAEGGRSLEEVLRTFASGNGEITRLTFARSSAASPLLLILTKPDLPAPAKAGPVGLPILIRIIDAEAKSGIDPSTLQQLFGLTVAESRLVGRLALGAKLEEATQALHISMSTARTHLARSFAKTGTSNQAQLISLALRTAVRTPRGTG